MNYFILFYLTDKKTFEKYGTEVLIYKSKSIAKPGLRFLVFRRAVDFELNE